VTITYDLDFIMPTPQDLLDHLNALSLAELFDPDLDPKTRTAYLKARKARLAHIKQLLKTDISLVKSAYGRSQADKRLETIELLPYLALEGVISNIQVTLSELQAAMVAGRPFPEMPMVGEAIRVKHDDDGYSVLIMDNASAREMDEEEARVNAERLRQKMVLARQQIESKHWLAAQTTLKGIDNPVAKKWLGKVESIIAREYLEQLSKPKAQLLRGTPNSKSDNASGIAFFFWFVMLLISAIVWLFNHV
jgi:hypothetical protein